MKILMITGSYPPMRCGVGDYTSKLVDALRNQEHEVAVLTSVEAAPDNDVHKIVERWSIASWPLIRKEIRVIDPDLIHIQYPTVGYGRSLFITALPLFIRVFCRKKVVVTQHEYEKRYSLLGKIRIILLSLFSNKTISTNEPSANLLKSYIRNLAIVPIGSNVDPIEEVRSQTNRLAYFGFIDETKGVDKLIEAVSSLGVELDILTGYDADNNYHQQIKAQIGDNARINWTGFLPEKEVSTKLHEARLVVLPFTDPATMRRGSMLAALAHGKATITTGPLDSPLIDKVNIYSIDGSTESIKEAVTELMNDDELRKKIESGASELAQKFSWDSIATKHIEVYEEIILR